MPRKSSGGYMNRRAFIKRTSIGTAAVLCFPKTLYGIVSDISGDAGIRKADAKPDVKTVQKIEAPKNDDLTQLLRYYVGKVKKGEAITIDFPLKNAMYALGKIFEGKAPIHSKKADPAEIKNYFELLCRYYGNIGYDYFPRVQEFNSFLSAGQDAVSKGAMIVAKELAVPTKTLIDAANDSYITKLSFKDVWNSIFRRKKGFDKSLSDSLEGHSIRDRERIGDSVRMTLDTVLIGANDIINSANNSSYHMKNYINGICAVVGIKTFDFDFSANPDKVKDEKIISDADERKKYALRGAVIVRAYVDSHVPGMLKILEPTPLYKKMEEEMHA